MTLFRRARWATALGAGFTIASMLCYPGGTALDRAAPRYSIVHNFLSDLGMTVAYGGGSNRLGASLFVSSLFVLIVGLGGCLLGVVRLFERFGHSRNWARGAGIAGLLACISFSGVALTPENAAMGLHVQFTFLAFRLLPFASFCLTMALRRSGAFPPRTARLWALLTVVLAAYALTFSWGPDIATPFGLTFYVMAQKVVSVVLVASMFQLSIDAEPASLAASDVGVYQRA